MLNNEKWGLDNYTNQLKQKKLIPQIIALKIGVIRSYGNHASHAQGEINDVNRASVQSCQSALAYLTNWFFVDYLQQKVPEGLAKPIKEGITRQRKNKKEKILTVFGISIILMLVLTMLVFFISKKSYNSSVPYELKVLDKSEAEIGRKIDNGEYESLVFDINHSLVWPLTSYTASFFNEEHLERAEELRFKMAIKAIDAIRNEVSEMVDREEMTDNLHEHIVSKSLNPAKELSRLASKIDSEGHRQYNIDASLKALTQKVGRQRNVYLLKSYKKDQKNNTDRIDQKIVNGEFKSLANDIDNSLTWPLKPTDPLFDSEHKEHAKELRFETAIKAIDAIQNEVSEIIDSQEQMTDDLYEHCADRLSQGFDLWKYLGEAMDSTRFDQLNIAEDVLLVIRKIKKSRDSYLYNEHKKALKNKTADEYPYVIIGDQTWMEENLNVDTFRNGDPIPHITDAAEWQKAIEEEEPAWCYYNNDPYFKDLYGKLYNWYAVHDERGLAPFGWHVPTDEDWGDLERRVGASSEKLRTKVGWKGTSWLGSKGNNESGFTAFPGGYRDYDGSFNGVFEEGNWWSSTYYDLVSAKGRYIKHNDDYLYNDEFNMGIGFSVRCILIK